VRESGVRENGARVTGVCVTKVRADDRESRRRVARAVYGAARCAPHLVRWRSPTPALRPVAASSSGVTAAIAIAHASRGRQFAVHAARASDAW
jgi:hypothetical protein